MFYESYHAAFSTFEVVRAKEAIDHQGRNFPVIWFFLQDLFKRLCCFNGLAKLCLNADESVQRRNISGAKYKRLCVSIGRRFVSPKLREPGSGFDVILCSFVRLPSLQVEFGKFQKNILIIGIKDPDLLPNGQRLGLSSLLEIMFGESGEVRAGFGNRTFGLIQFGELS